jgi:hypothetical protein
MAARVPSAGIHSHFLAFTIRRLSPVDALHAASDPPHWDFVLPLAKKGDA